MEARIQKLEERHVQVHKELLQVLDELYLTQHGGNPSLDKEKRRTAEVRRQLQMSLEKSSVILRALERFQQRDSDTSNNDLTTEDLLAQRLGKLMDTNYKLDHSVSQTLSRQMELSRELRSERNTYHALSERLKEVSSQLQRSKSESEIQQEQETEFQTPQQDSENSPLERENETIEQLLIALKVLGGYDFTS